MRILSAVHHDNAGAGVFGEAGGEIVEWMVPDGGPPPAPLDAFDALMVFGGSMHVDHEDRHAWLAPEKALIREAIHGGMPVLGVCLGSQLVAEAAGALPAPMPQAEIGWTVVDVTPDGEADPVIGPLAPSFRVAQWHSYAAPVPEEGVVLARNDACVQAFRLRDRPVWGFQFHAEVTAAHFDEWLDEFGDDPEAVATGLDPEALRAESRERMPAQNELGRELAARFLAEARAARREAA
jgi:GMP synthase (glutamine-hydrolysing)